ncbi:MAG: DUF1127 domain-containing protein [Marinibacterium sp.]
MASFDTTRPTFGASGFAGRLAFPFVALIGAIRTWNDARVTRQALSRLSDRELEDIGLTRGDIDLVAETRTN